MRSISWADSDVALPRAGELSRLEVGIVCLQVVVTTLPAESPRPLDRILLHGHSSRRSLGWRKLPGWHRLWKEREEAALRALGYIE